MKHPKSEIQNPKSENFKWPKNREDGSDLDENLTESIAAAQSIISEKFSRRFRAKTSQKLRKTDFFEK